MQTTRLRAIITVRIMAPHLQTIKMSDTDSGKSSASSKTTFGDSATSTTKEFAKGLLDNCCTVKVKRQRVWLSVRDNLEMSYCPALQMLQRET